MKNISKIQLIGWNLLMTAVTVLVFVWGIQAVILVEEKFLPVVKETTITKINREQNQVLIYGDFNKVRDCHFKHLIIRDNTKGANPAYLPIDLSPDGDPQPARLEGEQQFGPWAIPTRSDRSYHLSMIAIHNCGFPWLMKTHMIDFVVPSFSDRVE